MENYQPIRRYSKLDLPVQIPVAGITITLDGRNLKLVRSRNWRLHNGHLITTARVGSFNKPLKMGSVLLGITGDVVYIDGDPTNNRTANLRDASLKLCVKCGDYKAPEQFHQDRTRPDGRFPYCKSCRGVAKSCSENTSK